MYPPLLLRSTVLLLYANSCLIILLCTSFSDNRFLILVYFWFRVLSLWFVFLSPLLLLKSLLFFQTFGRILTPSYSRFSFCLSRFPSSSSYLWYLLLLWQDHVYIHVRQITSLAYFVDLLINDEQTYELFNFSRRPSDWIVIQFSTSAATDERLDSVKHQFHIGLGR